MNTVRTLPLLELCEKITVGHVGITSKYYSDHGVIFIRTQNVKASGLELEDVRYITSEFHSSIKKSKVFPGDLLLSRVVTDEMKSVIIPDDIGEANCANVILIRPSMELLSKYLQYLVSSPASQQYLLGKKNGSAQQVVNTKILRDWLITIPPISRQKQVVAILDQAFADIEKACAKTEQNLKNARELFESYLQQVFSQRATGVKQVPLSEITKSISDGDHSAPPKSESGVPFITISNINKSTNQVDFSNTFSVPEEYFANLKPTRKPIVGDVLYTVTGSYGIPVLVSEEKDFCFQRHIGLVRPNEGVDSKWLYYLLMSPQVFHQADSGATGTAQKTVSLKLLRGISVPNIPLGIQKEMVEGLDFMYEKSKSLEQVYDSKLKSLGELKKSILQKAFSGELTKDSKGVAA